MTSKKHYSKGIELDPTTRAIRNINVKKIVENHLNQMNEKI